MPDTTREIHTLNWITYKPGTVIPDNPTTRAYAEDMAALWYAYSDTFYSAMYGFSNLRQPRPGQDIDTERYTKWKETLLPTAFKQNLWTGPMPVSIDVSEAPENLLQYFYQRCLTVKG